MKGIVYHNRPFSQKREINESFPFHALSYTDIYSVFVFITASHNRHRST
jgi:hypothetical protein